MEKNLENVLLQLMQPDTEAIQLATQQIKELVKDASIVPVLCTVLATSQNPQVRQYAAVLLRRKLLKKKQWESLSADVCNNIRQNILQVLIQESEKSVRKSVAQIVGTIGKHDLPSGRWPELFQFFQTYIRSDQVEQRQMGMYVLRTLACSAAEQLKPHFASLFDLCRLTIADSTNVLVPYYTIQTLTELVRHMGTDELRPMQAFIPRIMEVVLALIAVDQDQATEALEIFDELVESEVSVIVPHIKPVMDMCLQIGSNKELDDGLRTKALSFISWITKLKRKSIMKLKLVQPILTVLIPIMTGAPEDEDFDHDDPDDIESQKPHSFAATIIDVMSMNLPPEKFIPILCRHIEPLLNSDDMNSRRTAFICMAVAAEGSSDYIRNKLLKSWLQSVYKGLNDPQPLVRNAALFALGQFSEHLQPDISKFSAELLPILFDYLGQATQHVDKDPRGVTKTYYALEMFVENLGEEIMPYLPQLMNYLLVSLASSPSLRAKELALSAIAATATAAEHQIAPYFTQIIEQLTGYLQSSDDESRLKLQTQAVDTLAVLARAVGPDTFMPLSTECMQLGLNLLVETDPDLRRCVYGLFAAISTLIKGEIGPYLPTIIPPMLEAMKSTEGVTAHYGDELTNKFRIFDDLDETLDDNDDDEDQVQGFSITNAYLDEKLDAAMSLGEISLHAGPAFLPHMPECYNCALELVAYPAGDVRKSAVTALCNFCCAMAVWANSDPNPDLHQTFVRMLEVTLDKLLLMVKDDTDRQVVMVIMEGFAELLDRAKQAVLAKPGRLDEIMSMVKLVILEKAACQDESEQDEPQPEIDEDQAAEYDAMLIESAGEVLPAAAKVVGGEVFAPYFASFLPEMLKRLKGKNNSTAEKSFAIGTIAETLMACGPAGKSFAPHLYKVFLANMRDEDDEVRSNSVFGLGVVAANGGDAMYSNYPSILKSLFEMGRMEKDDRCRDNIAAAVCRIIMANINAVPMAQVFPLVVQCLPLKKDFEENKTVYECITHLYKAGNTETLNELPAILDAVAQMLGSYKLTQEVQTLLVQFVQDVSVNHSAVLQNVMGSLPEERTATLQACVANFNGHS